MRTQLPLELITTISPSDIDRCHNQDTPFVGGRVLLLCMRCSRHIQNPSERTEEKTGNIEDGKKKMIEFPFFHEFIIILYIIY